VAALLIGCLLSACASSKEESVVTEPPEGVTVPAAHFARPTYNPADTGMSGSHFWIAARRVIVRGSATAVSAGAFTVCRLLCRAQVVASQASKDTFGTGDETSRPDSHSGFADRTYAVRLCHIR